MGAPCTWRTGSGGNLLSRDALGAKRDTRIPAVVLHDVLQLDRHVVAVDVQHVVLRTCSGVHQLGLRSVPVDLEVVTEIEMKAIGGTLDRSIRMPISCLQSVTPWGNTADT